MTDVTNMTCQKMGQYCDVALKLETIHGEIKSQLSSNIEITKSIRASQDAFNARIERILEKQETRIGAAEKKIWYASGTVSAVTAAITAGVEKIIGGLR